MSEFHPIVVYPVRHRNDEEPVEGLCHLAEPYWYLFLVYCAVNNFSPASQFVRVVSRRKKTEYFCIQKNILNGNLRTGVVFGESSLLAIGARDAEKAGKTGKTGKTIPFGAVRELYVLTWARQERSFYARPFASKYIRAELLSPAMRKHESIITAAMKDGVISDNPQKSFQNLLVKQQGRL